MIRESIEKNEKDEITSFKVEVHVDNAPWS